MSQPTTSSAAFEVALDCIDLLKDEEGHFLNPRRVTEGPLEVEGLMQQIAAYGRLLRPLLVRPAQTEGRYVLIDGDRRLSALKRLGWKSAPCELAPEGDAYLQMVTSGAQEELGPFAQLRILQTLTGPRYHWTLERASAFIGLRTLAWARLILSIADAPPSVQEALRLDRLSLREYQKLRQKARDPETQARAIERAGAEGALTGARILAAATAIQAEESPRLLEDETRIKSLQEARALIASVLEDMPALPTHARNRIGYILTEIKTSIPEGL